MGAKEFVAVGLLDVLVDNLRSSHGDLESFLDLDLFELLDILLNVLSHLLNVVNVNLLQLVSLRNLMIKLVFLGHKRKGSLISITNIRQELLIVLLSEVIQQELGVRLLRSVHKQVVSPHLWRDACLLGVVSKDACVSGLRELDTLIVEELCG